VLGANTRDDGAVYLRACRCDVAQHLLKSVRKGPSGECKHAKIVIRTDSSGNLFPLLVKNVAVFASYLPAIRQSTFIEYR